MKHEIQEVASRAITSVPPVSVAAWTWLGHNVADWVQVAALAWLVLQMGWFIWSKIIRGDKE